MKRLACLSIIALSVLLYGCASTYKAVVTLAETEKAAMRLWATAHNDGKTTVELDNKVRALNAKFLAARAVAVAALKAYKEGQGSQSDYELALNTLRATVPPVLDLIVQFTTPQQQKEMRAAVAKTNAP